MNKYIDAEKLIAEIERRIQRCEECELDGYPDTTSSEATLKYLRSFITSLQQEQPMPDSTKLIELWHEDKEMLKEKDFRDDPWRLAYNAFLCGFGRGIAVKKQKQLEMDLGKFTEKIKTFQGRYKYPEILSIKGAMAFMARMFYQYPNVSRQWYDRLPKPTMDERKKGGINMANFAKLYTSKCKNCCFCQEFWNGLAKRHFCQMKVQKYHEDYKKTLVSLTNCACEHFSPRYY